MIQTTQISARDVAEAILEVTGEALLSGDCESFCAVFHVPIKMAINTESVYIETRDDLCRAFTDLHQRYRTLGVTALNRYISDAAYVAPDVIKSTHISERIGPTMEPQELYPVFTTITKLDGVWKVTACEYAIDEDSMLARAIAKADISARASVKSVSGS